MKRTLRSVGVVAVICLVSGLSLAQKKNETNAALARQSALLAMDRKDNEEATKQLKAGKEFIDLAAAHDDTKNSQKTLWLKGEIYSLFVSHGMATEDMELVSSIGENGIDEAIDALKRAYPMGKKYKTDIVTTVDRNRITMNNFANMMYGAEQYKEAAEMYMGQAQFGESIGLYDTSAYFNAALSYDRSDQRAKAAPIYEDLAKIEYRGTTCAVLASSAYRKSGDTEKAKAVIAEARKKYPTDRELLLEVVNTRIDEGDAEGAEEALASAIETDPENKQLHYTIGTIYIDLKKYEKAEESLEKSLELDPDYTEAQYQLGAHLVGWAGELKQGADTLNFNDPNYNKLTEQSNKTYKRALIPLEKYILTNPKDADVLNILYQIHRNLGNKEKSNEYKQRFLDARNG